MIELVLDSVPESRVVVVLQDLVSRGRPDRVLVDGVTASQASDIGSLLVKIRASAGICIRRFEVPLAGFVDAYLNLLRTTDGLFDVELSFDLDDVSDSAQLAIGLHLLGKHIAGLTPTSSYYAGIEPAWDKDTRFFTDDSWGPFQLPEGVRI